MTAIEILAARAASVRDMAENIPSPCSSVCRMDAQSGHCEGCLRSIEEIRLWSISSDWDKKVVWALIAQRIATITRNGVSAA